MARGAFPHFISASAASQAMHRPGPGAAIVPRGSFAGTGSSKAQGSATPAQTLKDGHLSRRSLARWPAGRRCTARGGEGALVAFGADTSTFFWSASKSFLFGIYSWASLSRRHVRKQVGVESEGLTLMSKEKSRKV